MPGWLGSLTPEEWLEAVHGEVEVPCHVHPNVQCAGAAIYRTNVAKKPRDPRVITLPRDTTLVFGRPDEFLEHHRQPGATRSYDEKETEEKEE